MHNLVNTVSMKVQSLIHLNMKVQRELASHFHYITKDYFYCNRCNIHQFISSWHVTTCSAMDLPYQRLPRAKHTLLKRPSLCF